MPAILSAPAPPPAAPELRPRRRSPLRLDLRASCSEGAFYGGMVGFGETYLPAFVLAVGLGELTAGMVSSLPLLAGGVMQMVSPFAIRRLGSHKRWVLLCATAQGLSFVPLVLAAWAGSISGAAALLVATMYWAAGLATGPAWNTWMGTVVPARVRPKFFAVRTRASQAAVFLGFLMGGLALKTAATHDRVLAAFAGLFAIACSCRLISVLMLSCQSEPQPIPPRMRTLDWHHLLEQLRLHDGGRLLVFLAAVQGAVQMSGPYFTPFMFKKLHLNYGQYVLLIAVAYLAKVMTLPLWGRMASRIGAQRLLWVGGIGIAPLSAGWLVSHDVAWLTAVQIFGGVTWAAYELAFFLMFFESIAAEERTSMLTAYNLFNTTAWVAGSLVGGAVLYGTNASFAGYMLIFGLSSAGRCCALILLWRLPKRKVEGHEVALRTVAVRPHSASLDAPVLSSMEQPAAES